MTGMRTRATRACAILTAAGLGLAAAAAAKAGAVPVAGDGKLDVLYPFYAERSGGPYDADNAATPHVVFDAGRGKLVRFGGLGRIEGLPVTAEWDGRVWTGVPCDPAPPVQGGFRMAYDAARSNVVLFGAYPPGNQTWLYDGTGWTNASPLHNPPARSGHGMVYDAARQRVVLFGGYDGGTNAFGDTWLWDGGDWAAAGGLTNAPSARKSHQMAYDAARGVTVLLRGQEWRESASTWTTVSDMWEWDGETWRKAAPVALPAGTGSLVYDPVAKRVRWFDLSKSASCDIWTYSGGTWTKQTFNTSPYSTGQDLDIDPASGQAVYLKVPMRIQEAGDPPQTWVWNGSAWSNASPFLARGMAEPSAWGDVNGDGRPDLLAAGDVWSPAARAYGKGIALYLNEGGRLSDLPAWTARPAVAIGGLLVDDVNGDGHADAVVARCPGKVSAYLGGNGTFAATAAWQSSESFYAFELRMADVDGDGRRDLVALSASGGDGEVLVYLATSGLPATTAGPRYSPPPSGDGVGAEVSGIFKGGNMAWADLDGDGADEGALCFVYGNASTSAGPWVVVIDGTASNLAESCRLGGLKGPLAFVDIDGDWDFDLFAGDAAAAASVICPNEGGTIAAEPAWKSEGYGVNGGVAEAATGDFDGDGDQDLAKVYYDQGATSYGCILHRNDAGVPDTAPTWKSYDPIGTDAQAGNSIELVDFDGDGVLDVAATIGVYLLSRTLRDTVPPHPPGYAVARAATPANGDVTLSWDPPPDPDVAVYRIYRGLTDLWRTPVAELAAPASNLVLHTIPTGLDRHTVAAVDAAGNEGPVADFQVVAELADTNAKGDGKPDASVSGEVLTGDVDGDGDPDLFTRRLHVGGSRTCVSWAVWRNSAGAFTETWQQRWGEDEPGMPATLGDVTRDGRADLVVSTTRLLDRGGGARPWNVLDVYAGTGIGFSTSIHCTVILPGSRYLYDFAWGDANGDGYQDLAVAGAGSNGQAVVYHNLSGVLQQVPSWVSSVRNVRSVDFGDLDADNRDDLAVGEDVNGGGASSPLKVYVFRGTGSGTSPTVSWSDPTPGGGFNGTAKRVQWADYNGDGRDDLTLFSEFAAYCYANSGGSLPTTLNPWGYLYSTLFVQSGSGKPSHGLIGWANLDGSAPMDLYGRHSVLLAAGGFSGLRNDDNLPPWIDFRAGGVTLVDLIAEPWVQTGSLFPYVVRAADFNGDRIDDFMVDHANMIFMNARSPWPPLLGPSLKSLTVRPSSPITLLGAGTRQALTVTAGFSDGSTRDVSAEADISVVNPDDGLIVARAEGNELVAVNEGSIHVTVTWGVRSANVLVYVVAVRPRPVALDLLPAKATLTREGESAALTAIATLDSGERVDVTAAAGIASRDPSVAAVSGATVTAIAAGTARIEAAYAGLAATSLVEVVLSASIAGISIHPADAALGVGGYQGFEVRARFSDGSVQPVSTLCTLGCDNPSIATVDGIGVRALAPGVTAVTAAYMGRQAAARIVVAGAAGESREVMLLSLDRPEENVVALDWYCNGPPAGRGPFTIYCSTNLAAGRWTPVVSNLPAHASGFHSWTNPIAGPGVLYFRIGMDRQ